jgi:hypothetical protein
MFGMMGKMVAPVPGGFPTQLVFSDDDSRRVNLKSGTPNGMD